MNIANLNQRIDNIEDEIYREKLKVKKETRTTLPLSYPLDTTWSQLKRKRKKLSYKISIYNCFSTKDQTRDYQAWGAHG